jgi:hypothetical protein
LNLAARTRPAGVSGAVLAMALTLAACATEPTRLAIGSSRNQTLMQLGAPTAAYALPNGGERLQYSRAPAGFEVSNVDLDANGRVVSIRQEMDERLFDRTIRVGVWREADVLRTYGKPFEVSRVSSFDGTVWVWRFKTLNAPRLLNIYLDPAGVVQRYHTSDDLMLEMIPPG